MVLDRIALALAVLGGLNWGVIGIFRTDLIASLFGGAFTTGARIAYVVIGIAAIWCISLLFRHREYEPHPDRV